MSTTTYSPNAYWLVGFNPDVKVRGFSTYDQALFAYEAVVASDESLRDRCAVRSDDDPRWAKAPLAGFNAPSERTAMYAGEKWRKQEIGRTATAMIKAHGEHYLAEVERQTRLSLAARNISADRWEVERAVKDRITLGRCRKSSHWSRGCDRAYWFPKSQGPLHEQRCPNCGERLSQTTLALQAAFARLEPPTTQSDERKES